jgi:hypothetical protein
MRRHAILATAALCAAVSLTACASGGGAFPESGEPNAAISNATRLIEEARQAGADSLARDAIESAQRNLGEAQAFLQTNHRDRAALAAQVAAADARYARVAAQRARAERAHSEARAALQALPPGGA